MSGDVKNCIFDIALRGELFKDVVSERMVEEFGGIERCRQWFLNTINDLKEIPAFTTMRVNTLRTTVDEARAMLVQLFPNYNVSLHLCVKDAVVVGPPRRGMRNVVPVEGVEVIVDLRCGMAVLRGASVFAPGVLAAPQTMKVGDEVSVFVDVRRKCLRGFIKKFEGYKIFVGNGVARMSRQQLFMGSRNVQGVAVEMTHTCSPCPSIDHIAPNLFLLQNLPSIVCSHVLAPKCHEWVLDMCAAPGGKCTHLAALMNNQGVIIALDKTSNKVATLKRMLGRLGVTNVHPFVFDATKVWDASLPKTNYQCGITSTKDLMPPFASEMFDRILVDAPCSALGQRPQFVNRTTIKELRSYPKLQKKIIVNAIELLKPGGTLVYSTCTFTCQENEAIVHWILNKYPQLTLKDQDPYVGHSGLPWADLTQDQLHKLQRFMFYRNEISIRQLSCDTDTIAYNCPINPRMKDHANSKPLPKCNVTTSVPVL